MIIYLTKKIQIPLNFNFFFIICTFLFIVTFPFLAQSIGSSSLAFGLGLCLICLLFKSIYNLILNKKIDKFILNKFFYTSCLILFLFLHFLTTYFFSFYQLDFVRFIISVIFLLIIFLSANILKNIIDDLNDIYFKKIIDFIFFVLILLFIPVFLRFSSYSPFYYQIETYFAIYSEPSFYSLITIPFLYTRFFYSSNFTRCCLWILFFFFAFLIKSTVLFLSLFFLLLPLIVSNILLSLLFLLTFIFILIALPDDNFIYIRLLPFITLDFNYFSNLSSLVYLLDWEKAIFYFFSTFGFGIGFQQLGVFPYNSDLSNDIYRLTGLLWEIKFETFIFAPKIISEFGIFGVGLILFYLFYFFIVFYKLVYIRNHITNNSFKFIFFLSVYYSFFIYFFIRGIGYFTPMIFIFILSLIISKK